MKLKPEKNPGLNGIQTHAVLYQLSYQAQHSSPSTVYHELTKWPAPSGLIAQLVEHCTGIAEVMGSNLVQAWIFFFSGFNFTTAY